jgi:ABC-2 type transport system ATP-binding protein
MVSEPSIVVARKLTKVFKDFWNREKVTALSELDLEIEPREVFGLLGPNGSGKSTTLKLILGLLFPSRGAVSVFGRRPSDVATKARIGFLPEESYLYPFLDARETLDFYGRLFHQGHHERKRRVEMLLDMVGLSSVAHRRIGEYSKGMQRRIGLAQALINDPDLLILDEPTSGMDPLSTRQFKDLIVTLARRGKTVILSSHLLADVEDVCDRVCILYGGRQQALGSVEDLLRSTEHTQITTERLDDATLAKVREVLARAGREVVEISSPRERLENVFLRIVKEAQERRVRTGGATAGGGVAEFLRGQEGDGIAGGRGVIEELVGAGGRAGEGGKEIGTPAAGSAGRSGGEGATPSAPRPEVEVIDDLVRPGKPAQEKEATGAMRVEDAPRPRGPSAPTDRGVIDDLLKNARDDGASRDAAK